MRKKGTKSNISRKLQRQRDIVGYLFLAPNLIGFIIFMLIPFLYAFYISFFNWDGITEMQFTGLRNYVKLITNEGFRISFVNTLYYTLLNVPLIIIFGLGLALAVNTITKCKALFRTVFFLPNIVTVVSIVIVWQAFYHPVYGPLTMILKALGVENTPQWISDPKWAMICIIIMSIWINAGYYMIIFLAALNNVPESYYEAAEIDGAGKISRFFNITLPMISPSMFFAIIIAIINSFKVFDQVALLTQGGPGRSTNVLVYYVYQQSFKYYKFGEASAAAFILFALILIITVIQYSMQEKWVID